MKIQSPINSTNWKVFFGYKDLTVNFTNDEEPLICVFFYSEIIGYVTPQQLTDYIEINDNDFYNALCYVDEDGDKDIDIRHYEEMDFSLMPYAETVINMYLESVNELYSTLND